MENGTNKVSEEHRVIVDSQETTYSGEESFPVDYCLLLATMTHNQVQSFRINYLADQSFR